MRPRLPVIIALAAEAGSSSTAAAAAAATSNSITTTIAGLLAAPNLGLLACFDTQRSPDAHLLFVLLFFLPWYQWYLL